MGFRQKQQEEIDALASKNQVLLAKIDELENAARVANQSYEDSIQTLKSAHQEDITALENTKTTKENELNLAISQVKAERDEKQGRLDRRETKKLAIAYEEEEERETLNQNRWLSATIVVGLFLLASITYPLLSKGDWAWTDHLDTLPIDILLISILWFCASQFRDASQRKHDYANRKTIAQSFNNILNNLPEDEFIRPRFIEKATDVLCAPVRNTTAEPILTKKVLTESAQAIMAISRGMKL